MPIVRAVMASHQEFSMPLRDTEFNVARVAMEHHIEDIVNKFPGEDPTGFRGGGT